MKRKTHGIDPKIIGQAIATIVAFVLSFFAIELTAEVSGAIAVVAGLMVGFISPAPQVYYQDPKSTSASHRSDAGHSLIEVLLAVFLLLIILFVLFKLFGEADADALVAHWKN